MTSPLSPMHAVRDRLLTFEVGDAVYALPIAAVLEVAETEKVTCVPTVPGDVAGVMNWNGEALPVIAPRLVFGHEVEGQSRSQGPDFGAPPEPAQLVHEQVLVISRHNDDVARLGLPVDRVIGLVDTGPAPRKSSAVVAERRPVDGRVVHVLDADQLVARAEQVIESVVA